MAQKLPETISGSEWIVIEGTNMGFLARISVAEPLETWPSLYAAACERYWDGLELATCRDSRRTGAVYLWGYVAEIVLKVAFFRTRNWPQWKEIRLKVIEKHAKWRSKRKFHDIKALTDLLIDEHSLRGQPFDPVFAGQLKRNVLVIASHWKEDLRYRQSAAWDTEVAEVFKSTDWILSNYDQLWR